MVKPEPTRIAKSYEKVCPCKKLSGSIDVAVEHSNPISGWNIEAV